MRKTKLIILCLTLVIIGISCNSQKEKKTEKAELAISDNIEMYYFHFTNRCVTCKAIEAVSKEAIAEYYPEQIKNKKLFFTDVNLDEEEGKNTGKMLDINAQALLIVKGDKKYNITNEAFLHARTNPDKLKSIIKEKTDLLMQ